MPDQKKSFWKSLFGSSQLEQDKARLEAFLAAVPGEYCGFAKDQTLVYSKGFAKILGLEQINSITDIQNRLSFSDGAALENLFSQLAHNGTPFTLTAQNQDESKTLRLSGTRGTDLEEQDYFLVLWIEDITDQVLAHEEHMAEAGEYEIRADMLNEALDTIHRPIWIRDENQKLIWVNRSYAEATGMDKDKVLHEQKELISTTAKKKKVKDPEDSNVALSSTELAKKAFEKGERQNAKHHVIVGGNRLLMNIVENLMAAKDQKRTLGFALNITREEDLETEIRRFETSNKELLEQLRTAIAIFSSDKKLEFYNSAFSQLWGLEGGWLNTKPKLGDILEKLRERRRLPEQADFRRYKEGWMSMFTSLIDPHEDLMHLPDGSTVRMLVIPHSMGGIMTTFEDVTSRLELESSINTLIAVQKETLDNLGEGVAVYGGDGRLKLWNPAYARLWDLNPEDLDGEPHISGVADKKKKFFDEKLWSKQREQLLGLGLDRILHEGRYERQDGVLIDYSTVPLPDGGVLITYSDVTDKVQVENALREKNAALEAAERLKLEFLANVSYQLRTPLNAIMGFNEILDKEYFGPLNERQKEYTRDTHEASEKLLSLINDILDLSSIEAGYLTLVKEPLKILPMLEDLASLVAEWGRKESINVSIQCPKNIGTIMADERRIKQAMINLIRNAIAFTPEGGEITLSASRKKNGVTLSVIDTGVGIAEGDKNRIFMPFERAASEKYEKKRGAGLGLTLVKNIIELHGGSVELISERGKGTEVRLFIASSPAEKIKIKTDKKTKEESY